MVYGKEIEVPTSGYSDIVDITERVAQQIADSGIMSGIVSVTSIGSTASITTIEFEPALVADFKDALEKVWPKDKTTRHGETWGDDNGFSHIRASLMGPGISLPLQNGHLQTGTWQQIVVVDHDNRPRERRVFIQIVGE